MLNGQMSIYDFIKPDYKGSRDEIVRYHIENQLELSINLHSCCGSDPVKMFRSCREYYVICKQCGRKTKTYDKMYKAMQAWNRGLIE